MEKNRKMLLFHGDKTQLTQCKHTHFSKEMVETFEGILDLSYSLRSFWRQTFT